MILGKPFLAGKPTNFLFLLAEEKIKTKIATFARYSDFSRWSWSLIPLQLFRHKMHLYYAGGFYSWIRFSDSDFQFASARERILKLSYQNSRIFSNLYMLQELIWIIKLMRKQIPKFKWWRDRDWKFMQIPEEISTLPPS